MKYNTIGKLYRLIPIKEVKAAKREESYIYPDAEQEPHTCPYKVEIDEDWELCTCSITQEELCGGEI